MGNTNFKPDNVLKHSIENLFKEVGGERDQEMARLVKDNYPGSL